MHLDMSAYKNLAHDVPVGVRFTIFFFETGTLVSVVSIHVRNAETNRIFFLFRETKRKTTETD